MTWLTRKVTTYLVIVHFFTARDLDGSRSEVFPDERVLLGFKESSDIFCPFRLGVQHAFAVLAGEILDDSREGFGTNLVPKYTEATVGLWGGICQNADMTSSYLMVRNSYRNDHCVISM